MRFIGKLVYKNPVKLFFLVATIGLHIGVYFNSDKVEIKHTLVMSKQDGSNYFKVYKVDEKDGYVLEYNNIEPKSYVSYRLGHGYEPFFVLFSVLGIVTIISWVLPIFINDNDIIWSIEDVFTKSIKPLIHCEFEEGKYHYFIFNRLLAIENKQITNFSYEFSHINSISSILALPKYETKSAARKRKLKSLKV